MATASGDATVEDHPPRNQQETDFRTESDESPPQQANCSLSSIRFKEWSIIVEDTLTPPPMAEKGKKRVAWVQHFNGGSELLLFVAGLPLVTSSSNDGKIHVHHFAQNPPRPGQKIQSELLKKLQRKVHFFAEFIQKNYDESAWFFPRREEDESRVVVCPAMTYRVHSVDEKATDDDDSLLMMCLNTLVHIISEGTVQMTQEQLKQAQKSGIFRFSEPASPPSSLKRPKTGDDELYHQQLAQEFMLFFLNRASLETRCIPYEASRGLAPGEFSFSAACSLREKIHAVVKHAFGAKDDEGEDYVFVLPDEKEKIAGGEDTSTVVGVHPQPQKDEPTGRGPLSRLFARSSLKNLSPPSSEATPLLKQTDAEENTTEKKKEQAKAQDQKKLRFVQTVVEDSKEFKEFKAELKAGALTFTLKEDELITRHLVSKNWVRVFQTTVAVFYCLLYVYETYQQAHDDTMVRLTKVSFKPFLVFQDFYFRVFNSSFPATLLVSEIYREWGALHHIHTMKSYQPDISTRNGAQAEGATENEEPSTSPGDSTVLQFDIPDADQAFSPEGLADYEREVRAFLLPKKPRYKKLGKYHATFLEISGRMIKNNRVSAVLLLFLLLPALLFCVYGLLCFPIVSAPLLILQIILIRETRYARMEKDTIPKEMKWPTIEAEDVDGVLWKKATMKKSAATGGDPDSLHPWCDPGVTLV